MSNRKARKPFELPAVLHPQALLRFEQVQALVPMSKPAIYKAMADGEFPLPVRISHRTVAWRCADILALVAGFETDTNIDPNTAKAIATQAAKRALIGEV